MDTSIKPKGLKEILDEDSSLTEKITVEEFEKRKERMIAICGKTSEQKLNIAVNALEAIKTRIDTTDDYLNSTMLDIKGAVINALKMIGGKDNE